MTADRTAPTPVSSAAQPTVRRLIVFSLLFALVVIAAMGLSGLLGRLLDTGVILAEGDAAGLALSLAFTLIAGPLAALLWRLVWRRLSLPTERASLAWGLYTAALYSVALIVFTQALLAAATALVMGDSAAGDVATALVWFGVWAWHRWMLRDSLRGPRALADVPTVLGWVYGLLIAVAGSIDALSLIVNEALSTVVDSAGDVAAGYPWWQPVVQSLGWAAVGSLVWWWHFIRENARALRTTLARVAVIVAGVLGGSILTLGGIGVSLYVVLRLLFDRSDPLSQIVQPLGSAIATGAIGALVWAYHRRVIRRPAAATDRLAATLVAAGVALVATASGIGVIVNALLAAVSPVFVGTDARTLLLGGISSAIVGGPVWWALWKPARPVPATQAANPARRIYLIVVFGLSAVVALITLLVLGYRTFEFVLNGALISGLLERTRAPLGLLLATALVAAYHFVVWRRELRKVTAAGLVSTRRIGRIILVSGAHAAAEAELLHRISGAPVTVWPRAGTVEPGTGEPEQPSPDAAQLADALGVLSAKRVLVVVGPGSRIEAIGLAD